MAMETVTTRSDMWRLSDEWRRAGKRIAFVPTMGYLHEGHLSLFDIGRRAGDVLVVSIFVNPTQFGPNEDLERYPRDLEGDLAKARSRGVDVVYAPDVSEVYPEGFQTFVEVTELSKPLCGARRPGHFRGVATVVTKLFNVVRPHVAVFGQKDYQQLKVIQRLVRDLDMDIEILSGPIVREPDGLAMSSRNAYLSPEERQRALSLSRGLAKAEAMFARGERRASVLVEAVRKEMDEAGGVRIDYVELRDAETLEELERVEGPAVLAVAAFVGSTRLIDNVLLG